MTKKAIRVDCEKRIFYFIEIEISTYDKEVKDGTFPEEKHCFTIKEDELSKLY